MNKAGYLFILAVLFPIWLMAEDSTYLKPQGKVYGTIFSNFHSDINSGNNATAFEIIRAYLGYSSQLSKYFSANIKLDIGSPEDLSEYSRIRRYAYFKNAYGRYKKDKLTVSFGIIDNIHFKLQEKFWAHRYIDEVFTDLYSFGPSADLGTNVSYRLNDKLTVEAIAMNGEGYTRLQTDNTLKVGTGVTFTPWKNITTRLYYDVTEKTTTQSTLASFVGYQIKDKIIAGFQYDYMFNNNYVKNRDQYGYSFVVSYYPIKKWQVFGRYDKVSSNLAGQDYPWNLAKDGSAIFAGIEFSPIRHIKIALNYQDWFPYASNATNEQYIYLNMDIAF